MKDVTCNPIYYVAGPMRGYFEFNFPAFDHATKGLRDLGCEVFSPAEYACKKGFDSTKMDGILANLPNSSFDLRDALAAETNFICRRATHIFMLSGWVNSKGAVAERALGIALRLTIEGAAA